jgi:flagellar protein FlbD
MARTNNDPRTDTVLQLTRLGGPVFALNPDLIERAEATPDTVVTLVNGSRYVVRESLEELTALISEYRASIIATAQVLADRAGVHDRIPGLSERPHPVPERVTGPKSEATIVALRPGER